LNRGILVSLEQSPIWKDHQNGRYTKSTLNQPSTGFARTSPLWTGSDLPVHSSQITKTVGFLYETITCETNFTQYSARKNDFPNSLKGIVTDFADQGRFAMVTFDTGIAPKALVTRSTFIEMHIEVGQQFFLNLKPQAIKLAGKGKQQKLKNEPEISSAD
jgi:hypothetical protein